MFKSGVKRLERLATKFVRKVFPDFRINTFQDNEFLTYVYKKKLGLLQCADKIESLALRGSGADYDFLDQTNGPNYNLGLTSTDLHATYHLYKNSTYILPKLQNVIIFFVPIAPGLELTKSREKYRYVAYRHFFDIPYQDARDISKRIERRIIKKCDSLTAPNIPILYRGYDKKKYLGPGTDVATRAKAHLRENQREPDQMCWLNKMIELADQIGHRIWIVIPPFKSDFKSELPKSEVLFSKLYNMDIGKHTILDFYDDDRFDDSDMGDTDHLNEKGAIKITAKILASIQGVN
jgi:hypothetical protein